MKQAALRSYLVPVAVVVAIVGGVWWFVFRDSPEERGTKLLAEAGAALRAEAYDVAEMKLKAALELVPENGVLLHNLGILYLRQSRLADARAAFTHALATHGPHANQVQAEELYQLATISYLERKFPQAAAELERAIAADPTRVQLHARLLDLRLRRLEDEAATDSTASRFLRVCGRTSGNLEAAAYVYYQNERWERALALAREAVALADSQASAHALIARALWRGGSARDGLASLERPLERYPNAAELWIAQGAILLDDGRRQAALAAADRAVQLAPKDLEAHDLRRHALSNLGRLQEALAEIEIARGLATEPSRLQALQRDEQRLRGLLRTTSGSGATAPPDSPPSPAAVP